MSRLGAVAVPVVSPPKSRRRRVALAPLAHTQMNKGSTLVCGRGKQQHVERVSRHEKCGQQRSGAQRGEAQAGARLAVGGGGALEVVV